MSDVGVLKREELFDAIACRRQLRRPPRRARIQRIAAQSRLTEIFRRGLS